MAPPLDALLHAELAALDAEAIAGAGCGRWPGRTAYCATRGRALVDASSNDYLGLSQHPLVKARAAEWAQRHGAGAPASRLVTGTREITLAVEEKLAAFKGREAALLFSSGFQANATVIPALAGVMGGADGKVGAGARQMRRRFSATRSTTPASSTARAPRAARRRSSATTTSTTSTPARPAPPDAS
jgi:hypothetical protein